MDTELNHEFTIPIQSQERVDEYNKKFNKQYKSTPEHIRKTMDVIIDMIQECAMAGGSYMNDSIVLNVSVKYQPEEK